MNRLEQPASKIAPGIPWYSTPPCADNRLAAAALLRVVASSSRGHVNPHTKSPSIDALEQAQEPVPKSLTDVTVRFDSGSWCQHGHDMMHRFQRPAKTNSQKKSGLIQKHHTSLF